MPTRKALRSVIHNFLGTYTSRYSDRDGYWLFGYLVGAPALDIDLLGVTGRAGAQPADDAKAFATNAFVVQLAKHQIPASWLRSARLAIATSPDTMQRIAGEVLRSGRLMTFTVVVQTDRGRTYEASFTRFVAPHDPSVERQSRRCGR